MAPMILHCEEVALLPSNHFCWVGCRFSNPRLAGRLQVAAKHPREVGFVREIEEFGGWKLC
ncbi:MAG: hypothetical protein JNL18_10315 [Planctomycetaceae bacterium]|nr:hypothetical protein [Planctomycetaceae bacterium]